MHRKPTPWAQGSRWRMDPNALAEQSGDPMKPAPMDSKRVTQGFTAPLTTSGRAAFCRRTPLDSVEVSQRKPGSPLQWTNSNGKHQILLHKLCCSVQVGAQGYLMHFQGTVSLMYFQVCCGYLSFIVKLMKIIEHDIGLLFWGAFSVPTLSLLVTWLQQFLDHYSRIKLEVISCFSLLHQY